MYAQLAEIPTPTAAQFISNDAPGQAVLQVSYSVRDHARKATRSMTRSLVYSYDGRLATSTPLQDTDVVNQFIEIWIDGVRQITFDVTCLSGKSRPAIFLFSWETSKGACDYSPSLTQLRTRVDVRFGQAIFSSSSDKIIYATGHEFTSDGRRLGIKGCFNRPSGIWQLKVPSALSKEAAPEVACKKLTYDYNSCRSPRIIVHQERSFLVWLECSTGGPHLGCNRIYRHEITSDDSKDLELPDEKPLVPIVNNPGLDRFPGLYPAYNFPKSASIQGPGLSSGVYVLLHSQWGSRTTILRVSLVDGSVKDLTPADEDLYSWTVLTTNGSDSVICSRSSPSVPYEIMLGKFDSSGAVTWTLLEKPQLPASVSKALKTIRTSIIPIPERALVETILIQAIYDSEIDNGTTPPCILAPHGGPHSASTTAFSAATAGLALEGYTLSFPNYTGSPGYGQQFIQDLIDRCGELDVQDCITSARHLIKLGISEGGPGKQFMIGGSHSGFLGAHLIGQFPEFFSAAVLRNPVISVGEVSSTDIPDWYFAEFGFEYPLYSISPEDPQRIPPRPSLVTGETFLKLHEVSPIAHLDSIRAPLLLLVGAADRRVAPTHGIGFYHALKGRYAAEGSDAVEAAKKVELLIFEGEGHPLDGVEAAQASFQATKEWLLRAKA